MIFDFSQNGSFRTNFISVVYSGTLSKYSHAQSSKKSSQEHLCFSLRSHAFTCCLLVYFLGPKWWRYFGTLALRIKLLILSTTVFFFFMWWVPSTTPHSH